MFIAPGLLAGEAGAWPAAEAPVVLEASGDVHIEGAPFTPTADELYKVVFDASRALLGF